MAAIQAHALPSTLERVQQAAASPVLRVTAPLVEPAALAAARAAGLVQMPDRPWILDLCAITASAAIATFTGMLADLNAVPPQGPLAEDPGAAPRERGIKVAPMDLGQRADFVYAATANGGRPQGAAQRRDRGGNRNTPRSAAKATVLQALTGDARRVQRRPDFVHARPATRLARKPATERLRNDHAK